MRGRRNRGGEGSSCAPRATGEKEETGRDEGRSEAGDWTDERASQPDAREVACGGPRAGAADGDGRVEACGWRQAGKNPGTSEDRKRRTEDARPKLRRDGKPQACGLPPEAWRAPGRTVSVGLKASRERGGARRVGDLGGHGVGLRGDGGRVREDGCVFGELPVTGRRVDLRGMRGIWES